MKKISYIFIVSFAAIVIWIMGKHIFFAQFKEKSMLIKIEEVQKEIEKIFDTKAEFFPDEEVIKISFPRTDIQVTVQGWILDPFMGITSWISFQKGSQKGIEIMAMGDVVLLENEVNSLISIALEHDIKITALHNHFFYENPKLFFMHIEAEGTINTVVNGLKRMRDALKHIPSKTQIQLSTHNAINSEPIEKIIGVKGTAKDGMFKIVIGRKIQAGCGCTIGKNMGINTWAAFSGIDNNAIIDGDFAVLEGELQHVLKTLRKANINIVAIHNHMINENPRMIFLHYWGQGKTSDLAQAIKNALDTTHTFDPISDLQTKNRKSYCN